MKNDSNDSKIRAAIVSIMVDDMKRLAMVTLHVLLAFLEIVSKDEC